jgi:flagellar biosynthesis component FlhA
MAMGLGKGGAKNQLRGRPTVEPAFGMPAIWIPETERKAAERGGYVVIDPLTVMVTHLSEMLKRNLSDMITRQDVQEMLNRLKETNAAVVAELGQLQISVGLVQRILQNLLREGVSVRELSVILERLCDQFPYTKNIDELSEACRRALHLEIARQLDSDDGKLKVITLHPDVEQRVIESVRQTRRKSCSCSTRTSPATSTPSSRRASSDGRHRPRAHAPLRPRRPHRPQEILRGQLPPPQDFRLQRNLPRPQARAHLHHRADEGVGSQIGKPQRGATS